MLAPPLRKDRLLGMMSTPQEFERFETPLGSLIVRARDERDIPAHLDYLYKSPKAFLEGIGFDPAKFLKRDEMRAHILNRVRIHPPTSIAAELNGQTIALMFLDLADRVEEIPKLHFHVLKAELRGQGLGSQIFMAGLRGFERTHGFRKFFIEPRSSNLPMNALMRKLGFRHVKDYTLPAHPMTQEMRVSQYEIHLEP